MFLELVLNCLCKTDMYSVCVSGTAFRLLRHSSMDILD